MKKLKVILTVIAITAGLFCLQPAKAQYILQRGIFGNGCASISNNSYQNSGTAGQTSIGVAQNPDNKCELGFWYKPGSCELPEHWQFTSQTGSNATVILPTEANPNIEGTPLANGDYIGVFTPAGLCCGVTQWQGQDRAITVWGDDNQSTEIDGFKTGELIKYRVYRVSEQKEWESVTVEYSQGDGTYSTNANMILSKFDVSEFDIITLNLAKGWNMFSINVNPPEPLMDTIMTPIVNEVVIVKNNAGQTYIPEYGINDIGDIDFKEGYQAYLKNTVQFDMLGKTVEVTTPISLSQGWSMISYLRKNSLDIVTALASITNQLVIAKNNAGQTYIPQYGINDIGDMLPGQGYQVYLDAAGTLIYPSGGSLTTASFVQNISETSGQLNPEYFKFTSNTGENAVIVVPADIEPKYSNGKLLENGDEIAVFTPSGLCCGAIVWQGVNDALAVWGDNVYTDTLDGFRTGEEFHFRVRNKRDQEEYTTKVKFKTGDQELNPTLYTDRYVPDGISVLTELIVGFEVDVSSAGEPAIPSEFSLLQNYPNPFNPETTIEYHLPQAAEVRLTIYDLNGHEVIELVNAAQPAGYRNALWNGRDQNGRLVASGMYFYRIKVNSKNSDQSSFTDGKKMILMK